MTSSSNPVRVSRLNHAVLYVRDVERSAEFYRQALGFQTVTAVPHRAAFLRAGDAGDSQNHHDLGLFAVGEQAPQPPRGAPGLYHLAWEVPTIEDLAHAAGVLAELDALVGASDHGVSKSLYAQDPDGIEFEVLWRVPVEAWGDMEHDAVVRHLDLQSELAKWGSKVA
jgi:catechol-2,3-dioxygenase